MWKITKYPATLLTNFRLSLVECEWSLFLKFSVTFIIIDYYEWFNNMLFFFLFAVLWFEALCGCRTKISRQPWPPVLFLHHTVFGGCTSQPYRSKYTFSFIYILYLLIYTFFFVVYIVAQSPKNWTNFDQIWYVSIMCR